MSSHSSAPGPGQQAFRPGMTFVSPQARTNPAFQDPRFAGGSLPFFALRGAMLMFLPLIVASGALFQVQLLALHGRILVSTVVLKAMIIFLLLAALMLRGRISNTHMLMVTLVFVSYLILDGLRFYFALNIAGIDVIQGANNYYCYVLVAILALFVPFRITERGILRLFFLIFAVCFLIGIAQFALNSPLLPVRSNDGSFQVLGYNDFGTFRAFSLFLNNQQFGLLGIMAAALGYSYRRRKRSMIGVPLLVAGIIVVLISKSRENFAAIAAALATVYLITRHPGRRWHRLLPLIWLILGLSVGVFAFILSTGGGVTHSVTDTSTLTLRLHNWGSYVADFTMNDPLGMLFGYGIVQNHNVGTNQTVVPIDNFFLATVLDLGAVGICVVLYVAWSLWRDVLRNASETGSHLATAVAATFSTLLCLGLFQSTFEPVSSYYILYAVSQAAMGRRSNTPALQPDSEVLQLT